MEESKAVKTDSKPDRSRASSSLASKIFLDSLDFASVIACACTIFLLIYMTFVKDFIEILLYAIFKYINRFRWLYRIFQIDTILEYANDILHITEYSKPQEADSFVPKELSNNSSRTNVPTNGSTKGQSLKCSPRTPCSFKNKLMISPRAIDFADELSSAGIIVRSMNISPEENTVLHSEVLRSEDNAVLSPKQNFFLNPEDSNESDSVFPYSEPKSDLRQKTFGWNFKKIKDSFQKDKSKLPTLHHIKERCGNLAVKVTQLQPTAVGDKEKLIESSDSPKTIGCCDIALLYFKSKLQTEEIAPCSMHYKRF